MGDDSDAQLEQRVERLEQQFSERSSAKTTVPRRGVLAALGLGGLATLGTGTASAQAAGAVGAPSNPINVYGYDVEAQNSFTDPAGVEHTSELADIDDVGGSTSVTTAGATSQWGPRARDFGGTPPFPENWTKSADNPIITGSTSTNSQAGYPTLFHAGRYLGSPIDEWYLYWAGHDNGGINLHTAPDIEGPWTEYSSNPVYTVSETTLDADISSPWAIWDDGADQLRLYWHAENTSVTPQAQPTYLSTSSDGLSFTEQGECIPCPRNGNWDDNERSYAAVYRIGYKWVALYDGRDTNLNNKGLGMAVSSTGLPGTWETVSHPIFYNDYVDDVVSYDARADQQGPTPSLMEWGGNYWVLMSVGSMDNREIVAVRWDHVHQETAESHTILTATESWEDGSLEAPRAYNHNGKMYLFYNSQPSTDDRSIGLAYTNLEDYQ